MSVTSLTRSSSSASKAKCCSRLRGLMPQTPSRQSRMGTSFVPVASTLVRAVRLGLVSSVRVQYSLGKYVPWPLQLQFALGAEARHFLGADRQLDHPGVKVLVSNTRSRLVILRLQAERVGLDAQVDVLGDEDGRAFWDRPSGRPAASATMRLSTVLLPKTDRCRRRCFVKNDAQRAAVVELDALRSDGPCRARRPACARRCGRSGPVRWIRA